MIASKIDFYGSSRRMNFFWMNLLLGWTGILWVMLLIAACSDYDLCERQKRDSDPAFQYRNIFAEDVKQRGLNVKYVDRKVEDIAISSDLNREERIGLLIVNHSYVAEEAGELVDTAIDAEFKAKLKDKKREIIKAIEEKYPSTLPEVNREPIPEDVKREVWRRDNGHCVKCNSQEKLEFDHIIPIIKGGSNTARNIQLLCQKCNRKKGEEI
jgi:hypothetical protein